MTPSFAKGKYILRIEVTGISPVWTDKTKARYGSDDCLVTLDKIVVLNNILIIVKNKMEK